MDYEKLIESLIQKGWFNCDDFLPPNICQGLIEEMNSLPLKSAKIGKGINEQRITEIRNDSIYWLDESHNSSLENLYLTEMEKLRSLLNRELYLGLKQYEGHFARYERDGFYKKHLDQFSGNTERLVSVITYLNTPMAGGELRIYKKDNSEEIAIDITPKEGSLVCFLSNQTYHEVLPTKSERYSITGWLRTTIR